MKKTISIGLIIAMLIGMLTQVSFAESADILNIDFEDNDIGVLTAKDGASITDGIDAADGNRCLSIDKVNGVARIMFANAADKALSGGSYTFEFDIRTGWGGLCMSLFRIGDNYGNYGKSIFSSGTRYSAPSMGIKAYTTDGAKKPPSGNAGSETYIKGYRALGASSDMALTANKWHHVIVETDFENGTATVSLDGVKSAPVSGFDYFSGIAGIGFKWSPMKNDCDDTQKEAYIDNIRIYRTPVQVSDISLIRKNGKTNTSLSAVSPKTDRLTVGFSEAMDEDSVAAAVTLKNVSADEDVPLSLSSSDGKKFEFAINDGSLAENSDYRIFVGACASLSGGSAHEYTLDFSTVDVISAERISYFKADFEDETVGADAAGMYGYGNAVKNFAVVEEQDGNKYVNNTGSRMTALFGNGVTQGTVTAEFDMNNTAGMGVGVVYKNSTTTYGKWFLSISGGKINYYDKDGIVPPSVSVGHTYGVADEKGVQLSATAGEWHHYKISIDTDSGTFNMMTDDKQSVETLPVEFLKGNADGGIGGLSFFNSTASGSILVDNLEVYQSECLPTSVQVLGVGGEVITDKKIPSSAKAIRVKFSNPLLTAPSVRLTNKTSGADEVITEDWESGKYLTITPIKGYFDSESTYELTVDSGCIDVFDQICYDEFTKEFVTDKGGLNIMGLSVINGGSEISSAADIAAGDTLSVRANYVLTEATAAHNGALLTVVLENGGRLSYMSHGIVKLDKLGGDSVGFDCTVPTGAVFDKVYVYLWNVADRAPMADAAEY